MSTFTNFHTWATGETMTAALLNGITNSLVTAGNAIDRTNLTAGAGIDASQIKPSSGAAGTFGGSVAYTFPLSLITTVGSNSVVPLTVQGNSGGGQTADLLDVLLQPAGTNFFAINNNGAILPNGNGTIPAGSVAIGADAGGTKGLIANVPTGSSNGIQLQVNGTTLGKLSATGDFQAAPLMNSTNTLGRVLPTYITGPASIGATGHIYFGTINITVNGPIPAGNVITWSTTNSITIPANVAFTSSSSYFVFPVCTTHQVAPIATPSSGSVFTINASNVSGNSIGNGQIITFGYIAVGT